MAGKIPMTKELFWNCLNICNIRFDIQKFDELWNKYPEYVKAFQDEYEKEFSDLNSPKRIKADLEWKQLKEKLIEKLGEDWVSKHCKY